MKDISETDKAYIAGFLDADGSIYAKIKPNDTYRYNYQISQSIVFYQKTDSDDILKQIASILSVGYIRLRNDGITEYTIGDKKSIRKIIKLILPYLKHKNVQANLMLKIIDSKIDSKKDLIRVCRMVDKFEKLNYSKKRKNRTEQVLKKLNNC